MRRMQLFFRLGSWTLILTAVLHLAGHFADGQAAADETEAELLRLLATYARDYSGLERTTQDFLDGYSLSFAVLVFFIGVSNLVMMRVHHGRIKGLRVQALLSALLSAALLVLSSIYFILPPLVCFGLCLTFFGLAVAAGQYQFGWERTAASLTS